MTVHSKENFKLGSCACTDRHATQIILEDFLICWRDFGIQSGGTAAWTVWRGCAVTSSEHTETIRILRKHTVTPRLPTHNTELFSL